MWFGGFFINHLLITVEKSAFLINYKMSLADKISWKGSNDMIYL